MNMEQLRIKLAVYYVMSLQGSIQYSAEAIVAAVLKGGITMLQLREKDAPVEEILQTGQRIKELCRAYEVPFIVNDRVDIAMLLDADGVHLGQDDIPCAQARSLLGDDKIIGASAGTYEEALRSIEDGADYLGVGPVYATATKKDAGLPIGTTLISQIRTFSNIPIVGIGGIHADNATAVTAAGGDGVAVVSAISAASDPQSAALRLAQILQ